MIKMGLTEIIFGQVLSFLRRFVIAFLNSKILI